jgi:hypothetical protein
LIIFFCITGEHAFRKLDKLCDCELNVRRKKLRISKSDLNSEARHLIAQLLSTRQEERYVIILILFDCSHRCLNWIFLCLLRRPNASSLLIQPMFWDSTNKANLFGYIFVYVTQSSDMVLICIHELVKLYWRFFVEDPLLCLMYRLCSFNFLSFKNWQCYVSLFYFVLVKINLEKSNFLTLHIWKKKKFQRKKKHVK